MAGTAGRRPRTGIRPRKRRHKPHKQHSEYLQYAPPEHRACFAALGVELVAVTSDKQLRQVVSELPPEDSQVLAIRDITQYDGLMGELDKELLALTGEDGSKDPLPSPCPRPEVEPDPDMVHDQYIEGGEELEREVMQAFPRVFRDKAWAAHEVPPDVERPVMELRLKPDATPQYSRPIRLTFEQGQLLRQTLQTMEERGLVVRSSSSWGAPAFFIPKIDAQTQRRTGWRMCIDMRKCNSQLIQDNYPFPNADEMLDKLAGYTIFSALDFAEAWYTIRLRPEQRHIAAICTSEGLWEPTCAIFGLASAPSTWTRWMDTIFADFRRRHPDVLLLLYADDALVCSRGTAEEHRALLEEVLTIMQKYWLVCPSSKTQMFRESLVYLGHIIDKRGRRPHPAKLKVIRDRPLPSTLLECQQWLGLVNYYRRFSPLLGEYEARIRACLKPCRRPHDRVPWTPDAEQAFIQLKEAFCKPPILLHPYPDRPFTVVTDASDTAMGGFLAQDAGQGLQPVEYFSKGWDATQRAWDPRRKEAYALIYALEHWRHYLLGARFTCLTDHESLTTLMSQAKFKGRAQTLQRYLEFLSAFNFRVHYIRGADNVLADLLSRPKVDPIILEARPDEDRHTAPWSNCCLMAPGCPTSHLWQWQSTASYWERCWSIGPPCHNLRSGATHLRRGRQSPDTKLLTGRESWRPWIPSWPICPPPLHWSPSHASAATTCLPSRQKEPPAIPPARSSGPSLRGPTPRMPSCKLWCVRNPRGITTREG